MMTPDAGGRFFEDFTLGEKITHATPRTLESGDIALYQALYGGRHILNSSLLCHPTTGKLAGVSYCFRQNRAGYFAQCHRKSGLC
jgi:hypothetical protein